MHQLPAQDTYSLAKLAVILQKKEQEFREKFPTTQLVAMPSATTTPRTTPEPEKDEIFAKLSAAAASLANLPEKEELYLEQQLSDLLGFEVSSSLEGHKLTHAFGKIHALPEFALQPQDQLERPPLVRGAQLKKGRPSLGWKPHQETTNNKQFLLANHLLLLEDWHLKYAHYKNWYKWRKLLVINPFNRISVVVELAAFTIPNPMQYQFGGSPNLIRAVQAWSSEAQGNVCVFFIPDDSKVNGGVQNL